MPGLLCQEHGRHGRYAIQNTFHVDIDHLVPVFGLQGGQRRVRHQPCVQENDVHTAECFFGQLNDAVVFLLLCHVQHLINHLSTAQENLVRDLLELVFASRTEHDFGAFAREQLAVASPIPDDAPVMMTTLSLIMISLSGFWLRRRRSR